LILEELLLVFRGSLLYGCKLLLKFGVLCKCRDTNYKRYRNIIISRLLI
jgi:hypothetical protein